MTRILPIRSKLRVAAIGLSALALLALSSPMANAGDHRGDRYQADRDRGERHDEHRDHRGWGQASYPPPPVVYGSPYYAPPPVVYGPSIGIMLPGIKIGRASCRERVLELV